MDTLGCAGTGPIRLRKPTECGRRGRENSSSALCTPPWNESRGWEPGGGMPTGLGARQGPALPSLGESCSVRYVLWEEH